MVWVGAAPIEPTLASAAAIGITAIAAATAPPATIDFVTLSFDIVAVIPPSTHVQNIGFSVVVVDHVDDVAVGSPDEKSPQTPRLGGQRMDDVVAQLLRLRVRRVDVIRAHRNH
jgi:hypothetical protein